MLDNLLNAAEAGQNTKQDEEPIFIDQEAEEHPVNRDAFIKDFKGTGPHTPRFDPDNPTTPLLPGPLHVPRDERWNEWWWSLWSDFNHMIFKCLAAYVLWVILVVCLLRSLDAHQKRPEDTAPLPQWLAFQTFVVVSPVTSIGGKALQSVAVYTVLFFQYALFWVKRWLVSGTSHIELDVAAYNQSVGVVPSEYAK